MIPIGYPFGNLGDRPPALPQWSPVIINHVKRYVDTFEMPNWSTKVDN